MSRIIVDSIRNSSASSDALTLSSDGKVAFPNNTGNILQVVQTVKTDVFSFAASATGNTSGGVSGDAITASLACSSTSNKVLIRGSLSVSTSNNNRIGILVYAGGTQLTAAIGAAAGNRSRVNTGGQLGAGSAQQLTLCHEFLHSPSSTSSITYSYRLVNLDSSNSRTLYLNRGQDDTDAVHHFRSSSIITLEEVAA